MVSSSSTLQIKSQRWCFATGMGLDVRREYNKRVQEVVEVSWVDVGTTWAWRWYKQSRWNNSTELKSCIRCEYCGWMLYSTPDCEITPVTQQSPLHLCPLTSVLWFQGRVRFFPLKLSTCPLTVIFPMRTSRLAANWSRPSEYILLAIAKPL